MIEIVSLIVALLVVLTMGGMCFDWIGSGMTDPIYRKVPEPQPSEEDSQEVPS